MQSNEKFNSKKRKGWRNLQLGLGLLGLHDLTHVEFLLADLRVSKLEGGLQPVTTIDDQDLASDI